MPQCQNPARPMRGGKQQARKKGEMIHKEAELSLVSGPKGRAVEGKGEEDHVKPRKKASF